jgi:hypothetical protein
VELEAMISEGHSLYVTPLVDGRRVLIGTVHAVKRQGVVLARAIRRNAEAPVAVVAQGNTALLTAYQVPPTQMYGFGWREDENLALLSAKGFAIPRGEPTAAIMKAYFGERVE